MSGQYSAQYLHVLGQKGYYYDQYGTWHAANGTTVHFVNRRPAQRPQSTPQQPLQQTGPQPQTQPEFKPHPGWYRSRYRVMTQATTTTYRDLLYGLLPVFNVGTTASQSTKSAPYPPSPGLATKYQISASAKYPEALDDIFFNLQAHFPLETPLPPGFLPKVLDYDRSSVGIASEGDVTEFLNRISEGIFVLFSAIGCRSKWSMRVPPPTTISTTHGDSTWWWTGHPFSLCWEFKNIWVLSAHRIGLEEEGAIEGGIGSYARGFGGDEIHKAIKVKVSVSLLGASGMSTQVRRCPSRTSHRIGDTGRQRSGGSYSMGNFSTLPA